MFVHGGGGVHLDPTIFKYSKNGGQNKFCDIAQ